MADPLDGILTIAGPCGGAGRTTLTLGIGSAMAQAGTQILVVDLDPRGSLTYLTGLSDSDRRSGLLEALTGNGSPSDHVISTGYPGLSILPSDCSTVTQGIQMETAMADVRALPRALVPLLERFSTIILDAPAGVGRTARAAIAASDRVMLALNADPLAVRTLPLMLEAISDVRHVRSSPLELAGIALNRVQPNAPLFRPIVDDLFDRFQPLMLDTAIPSDAWFVEAAARGMPLSFLLPESAGAVAMLRLVDELRRRSSH